MLTRFVVSTYKVIAELALWLMLLFGAGVGFAVGRDAGQGMLGLLIGGAVTFFILAIFLGAALVLEDIHTRVANIERLVANVGAGGSHPSTALLASNISSVASVGSPAAQRVDTSINVAPEPDRTAVHNTSTESPVDEQQLMSQLGITFDGTQYVYGEYKYDRLRDAINYARRDRTRGT